MESIPETLAQFIKAFDGPSPAEKAATDWGIDLDQMAREGRLAQWLTEGREPNARFHPSSLADPCMRFDVVRLMLVDHVQIGESLPDALQGISLDAEDRDSTNFDYELQRMFDTGTALHEMEQTNYFGNHPWAIGSWRCSICNRVVGSRDYRPAKPCQKTEKCLYGRWVYVEPRISVPALGITGKVDQAFRPPRRGDFIIDIKTMGSKKFARLAEMGSPFQKDETQVKIYLMAWPAELGIIRCLDQGAPEAKPVHFNVVRDPIVEESIKHYILQVRDLAAQGRWSVATPACAKATYARAKRCPLNTLCFA